MSEPEPMLEVSDDLRASLATLAGRIATQPGVFGLTSCARGEGVSFTTANLGIALAGCTDEDVVLVDANLDASVLHAAFGLEASEGSNLLNALNEDTALEPVKVSQGLYLLPSGSETLGTACSTSHFGRVLARLRERFSHVVVDLPSLASVGMAAEWAAVMDQVGIVVEAEKTRWQSVVVANDRLTAAGAKVAGVVMNKRRLPIPGWLYRRL